MIRKKTKQSFTSNDLDKPYRRGVILGLSLAEVFLLLVFLLLLVLTGYAGLVREEMERKEKATQLAEPIIKYFPDILPEEIEDIIIIFDKKFKKGMPISKQLERLIADVQKLKDENQDLKKVIKGEKKLLELLSEKNTEISKLNIQKTNLENQKKKLISDNKILQESNKKLQESNKKLSEKVNLLEKLINKNLYKQIEILKNENKDLKKIINQLNIKYNKINNKLNKNIGAYEEIYKRIGDGTLKISCWTEEDKKIKRLKTVNIFDVLLTNNGIKVHNKKTKPEFEKLKKSIPLNNIIFNKTLSRSKFLDGTKQIWQYGLNGKGYRSINNKKFSIPCLYNIQVFDKTTNDTIYRNLKENGLEQRFNVYIRRDNLKWPH